MLLRNIFNYKTVNLSSFNINLLKCSNFTAYFNLKLVTERYITSFKKNILQVYTKFLSNLRKKSNTVTYNDLDRVRTTFVRNLLRSKQKRLNN